MVIRPAATSAVVEKNDMLRLGGAFLKSACFTIDAGMIAFFMVRTFPKCLGPLVNSELQTRCIVLCEKNFGSGVIAAFKEKAQDIIIVTWKIVRNKITHMPRSVVNMRLLAVANILGFFSNLPHYLK
jgi:hypothetical protein